MLMYLPYLFVIMHANIKIPNFTYDLLLNVCIWTWNFRNEYMRRFPPASPASSQFAPFAYTHISRKYIFQSSLMLWIFHAYSHVRFWKDG